MSTLWTPEGEHRVPRERPNEQPQAAGATGPADAEGAASTADAEGAASTADAAEPDHSDLDGSFEVDPDTGIPIDPRTGEPFDPEELAEMEARLREAQEQLLSVPAAVIVQNHMMGLFELAALHLRQDPPDLEEARLPIDALGLLVDHLADQMPDADTLRGALQQIRLAFVEVHKRQAAAD